MSTLTYCIYINILSYIADSDYLQKTQSFLVIKYLNDLPEPLYNGVSVIVSYKLYNSGLKHKL